MSEIISLSVVALALVWLGFETDWLRVNLAYSRINPKTLLFCAGAIPLSLSAPSPVLLLDTVHFKHSEFVPLDMPELSGSLNIVCRRE